MEPIFVCFNELITAKATPATLLTLERNRYAPIYLQIKKLASIYFKVTATFVHSDKTNCAKVDNFTISKLLLCYTIFLSLPFIFIDFFQDK